MFTIFEIAQSQFTLIFSHQNAADPPAFLHIQHYIKPTTNCLVTNISEGPNIHEQIRSWPFSKRIYFTYPNFTGVIPQGASNLLTECVPVEVEGSGEGLFTSVAACYYSMGELADSRF